MSDPAAFDLNPLPVPGDAVPKSVANADAPAPWLEWEPDYTSDWFNGIPYLPPPQLPPFELPVIEFSPLERLKPPLEMPQPERVPDTEPHRRLFEELNARRVDREKRLSALALLAQIVAAAGGRGEITDLDIGIASKNLTAVYDYDEHRLGEEHAKDGPWIQAARKRLLKNGGAQVAPDFCYRVFGIGKIPEGHDSEYEEQRLQICFRGIHPHSYPDLLFPGCLEIDPPVFSYDDDGDEEPVTATVVARLVKAEKNKGKGRVQPMLKAAGVGFDESASSLVEFWRMAKRLAPFARRFAKHYGQKPEETPSRRSRQEGSRGQFAVTAKKQAKDELTKRFTKESEDSKATRAEKRQKKSKKPLIP